MDVEKCIANHTLFSLSEKCIFKLACKYTVYTYNVPCIVQLKYENEWLIESAHVNRDSKTLSWREIQKQNYIQMQIVICREFSVFDLLWRNCVCVWVGVCVGWATMTMTTSTIESVNVLGNIAARIVTTQTYTNYRKQKAKRKRKVRK